MAVKDNTYKFAVPTCRTIIEQNDRKETNTEKKKVKGAFSLFLFFTLLWSVQHLRESQSSTVNISENSLCYPFMQPTDFHRQQRVFLCFLEKRKQQSKPFHDDDDTHIQRFGNFRQDDDQLSFNTEDQQRKKNNHKPFTKLRNTERAFL